MSDPEIPPIMPVLLPSAECAMEIDSAPEISNHVDVKQLNTNQSLQPEPESTNNMKKKFTQLTYDFIFNASKQIGLSKYKENTGKKWKSLNERTTFVESMFKETELLQKKLESFISEKSFLFTTPLDCIKIHPNYQNFQEFNNYPDCPNGRISPPLPPPNKTIAAEGLEVVSFRKIQNIPYDLPPVGELVRSPLEVGAKVYAMKSNFLEEFLLATVINIRDNNLYKILFDTSKTTKLYPAKYLAYTQNSRVALNVKTRIIARYDDGGVPRLYAGTIAEEPKPLNRGRYLVFFDDGFAQYMGHKDIYVMCDQSENVYEDVDKGMQTFIRTYFGKYPERPMVKVQKNQIIKTEFNNSWWDAKVLEVDGSMAYFHFLASQRNEWIYRGSTRLEPLFNLLNQTRENSHGRVRRHNINPARKPDQPYVEFTNDDVKDSVVTLDSDSDSENKNGILKRPRRKVTEKQVAVAVPEKKKNTARKSLGGQPAISYLNVTRPTGVRRPDRKSMIGYKDIENMNTFNRAQYVPHQCGIRCREKLNPAIFRAVNPFRKPSHSGWERQILTQALERLVLYRAPCGRQFRNLNELIQFLVISKSKLTIDLYTVDPCVHTFQYFRPKDVLFQCDDITNGRENIPISCVNIWSKDPPDLVPYTPRRIAGENVPLNLDKGFISGCSCTDNCMTPGMCDCQKLTNYAHYGRGFQKKRSVGYEYRRLKEPLLTGIFECNEWCKCGPQCGNRVVQNGLQVRLQMFRTMNKGWGVRCVDDIPEGMFICIYAGQLLNDETADEDGKVLGDEYMAELDHIEVVENCKKGYEENVDPELMDVDEDKKSSGSSAQQSPASTDSENDSGSDFESSLNPISQKRLENSLNLNRDPITYNSRGRKKTSSSSNSRNGNPAQKSFSFKYGEDSFSFPSRPLSPESMEHIEKIELRVPKVSTDEADKVKKKSTSKHSSKMKSAPPVPRKSTRDYYNEEDVYIMDAKTMGNIGKYLNHSCNPNCFVQNVFVDTHDLRFPEIAFFTSDFVTAGTELTWDYNYNVGSVDGKCLLCYCDSRNCRGRLL